MGDLRRSENRNFAGAIIDRGNFDNIATDDVDSFEAIKY